MMIAEPSSPPQPDTVEQVVESDEKEIDFSFKQLRKIALGDDITQLKFNKGDKLSLLCSSKLYGLVFIAKTNGFITFQAHNLVKCHEANYTLPLRETVSADKSGIQIQRYELETPFFISLNSDNSVLICLSRNSQNIIIAAFYDITIFSPNSPQSNPSSMFPLTNDPNLQLTDLQWNPTKPDSFAVCFSNGLTHLMQFKLPQSMQQLSVLCKITTSICWSPKGKHIAMGTNEGTIEQWSGEDGNFKLVKFHQKVENFGSLLTKIMHLKWISSYLFAVVYSIQTESGSFEQILVLKHSKKGEPPLYVNFNDIYSQSENSETFYFSELFVQQKILITTTGLANEVVVLANHGNATTPMEWFSAILDETSRAEVPLDGIEESYTMGLAVDTSSQSVIPSDRSPLPLPPHPILLLLTTKGVLCPFHMIYQGMSELVEPPRVLKSAKQLTNPQAVTKNLSTTTVTVVGSNTATTAKNTTYTITSQSQGQTQPQLIPQNTTATFPSPIQSVPPTATTLISPHTVATQQHIAVGPQQLSITAGQQRISIGPQQLSVTAGQQRISIRPQQLSVTAGQQHIAIGSKQHSITAGQQSITVGQQHIAIGQQHIAIGQQHFITAGQQSITRGQQQQPPIVQQQPIAIGYQRQSIAPSQQQQQQQQQQQPIHLHNTPSNTLFVPQTSPNKIPTDTSHTTQPAMLYTEKSANSDTAGKEQKQTTVPTQQQPTTSIGQQQQQQQQQPSIGQHQQPITSIGQQQQQQPTTTIGQQQQQQQQPSIGQHQQPITSIGQQQQQQQQQQPTTTIGQQQQQQQQQQHPLSIGQQPQPNLLGQQQQKQPQISPQTPQQQTQPSAKTQQQQQQQQQQNTTPTPKPTSAYIPPNQPITSTTPTIIPPGVQPQYTTSQTQPTISLTIPAPSPLEISVRYETHIWNEIEDFSDDLETLKSKIRQKFGDFDDPFQSTKDLVGSDGERKKMYKDTARVRLELDHTVKICEDMNQILSTIRNEGFHIQEKIEDANTAKKWISTAKFGSFIAATPLDPISEEKKRLLIQTYNAIDQRLQEIEISMEEMLIRSSDNDKQAVMQTIRLLEQNLQKLQSKLDGMSEQVDTVKLNRQISRINLSNSCIHPLELLNKSLEKRRFNFKIQSDRIVELKDFLYQTPTPRIIKPRNPTDSLNIPRTVKPATKPKSIPDLQQPKPFTTSPNQGFKLLLSPQGEFFVLPNPQSLPDGCVSFDTSQLHRLSQSMTHASPKQQQQQLGFQPTIPKLPVQVDQKDLVEVKSQQQQQQSTSSTNVSPQRVIPPQQQQQTGLSTTAPSDYSRSSMPKTLLEHKPQQQQPNQPGNLPPMPNLLQMAGQKPDYDPSSLPKTTIEHKPPPSQQQQQQSTSSTNISPQKVIPPQQQQQQQQQQSTSSTNASPQKVIPPQQQQQQSPLQTSTTPKEPSRVNRVLDFSTPPKPLTSDTTPNPLTPFKSPDSTQPAPNVNPFVDPSYPLFGPNKVSVSPNKQPVTSSSDPPPTSPTYDPRIPKARSDMRLFSLLSAGDAKNANLSSTAKPPSSLLQSTSADSNTSPAKTTEPHQIQLDESQTLNIQKSEVPLKQPKAKELNESQTINIPENTTTQKPQITVPSNISQTSIPHGFQGQTQQAVAVPQASPEGDSEMQDENEYGDAFQGISLGNQGNAKPTATNYNNPFSAKTAVPTGGNGPFSGRGQSTFAPPNMAPQTQPQGTGLFGGRTNFGGTPNLFQGPSLLQGIGANQPKLFGQTTSAPTFGSIASQNKSPQSGFGQQSPFGQPTFGQAKPLFSTNQGQGQDLSGIGSLPSTQQQSFGQPGFGSFSGSNVTSEMKGKAFTSYRS